MDKGLSFLFISICSLIIILPLQAYSEKGLLEEKKGRNELEQVHEMKGRNQQELEKAQEIKERNQEGREKDQQIEDRIQEIEQGQQTENRDQKELEKIQKINVHDEQVTMPKDTEVFEFLKSSFSAQVSLSEKYRSMEEIEAVLEPYFSEEYKQLFIEANVVAENGQYLTYGSDFAPYYIPFYSYSEKTKVIYVNDSIYVVEFFPASTDGPVGYESHYEGIEILLEDGEWKVNTIWYDHLPDEVIEKASNMDAFSVY